MYNITIETAASYAGKSDTYTIEQGDKSIPVTHEVGGFMNKNVKPETTKLLQACEKVCALFDQEL